MTQSRFCRTSLVAFCAVAFVIAGCGKKPVTSRPSEALPPPPAAKPTVSISADRTSISKGDSVKLSWTSTDAQNISIAPEVGAVTAQGTTTVTPGDSTTYTITASGTEIAIVRRSAWPSVSPASPRVLVERARGRKRMILADSDEDDTLANMPVLLELESLRGRFGRAVSTLRPSGITDFDGRHNFSVAAAVERAGKRTQRLQPQVSVHDSHVSRSAVGDAHNPRHDHRMIPPISFRLARENAFRGVNIWPHRNHVFEERASVVESLAQHRQTSDDGH